MKTVFRLKYVSSLKSLPNIKVSHVMLHHFNKTGKMSNFKNRRNFD